MHVDHDRVGALAERARVHLLFRGAERTIERVHEDAAHGIDDQDAGAIAGLEMASATSGRPRREIQRP